MFVTCEVSDICIMFLVDLYFSHIPGKVIFLNEMSVIIFAVSIRIDIINLLNLHHNWTRKDGNISFYKRAGDLCDNDRCPVAFRS